MSRKATVTKPQTLQPPLTPSAELQLLNVFVGKWPTEGLSYGTGQSKENPYDSPVRWIGAETYEWLPGGFFLVRHFNGQIGDLPMSGIETIGYDAVSQTYSSQIFDNYGRIHLGQRTIRDGVWSSSIGTEYRTTYTFRNDGNNLATHWEWLDGDDWSVLTDSEGTKVN
ncbi:DUF1579 family protein [Chamaesiphon sp. OTE_8_metabat_110]|uniref:DUF1579 family protein n=1 Tax=Chamaesiphon sp. OTE_8_metabat_110 TaxID=2964696 RepID=UPI00286B90D4|nr:DUF1579 family protein [Chamaesiphon sp. OTE_8_metabat_110]